VEGRIAIECQALRNGSGTTRIVQALASGLAGAGFEIDLYAESVQAAAMAGPGVRWQRLAPFPLGERFLRKSFGGAWVGTLKQKRIARANYGLIIGNRHLAAADLFLVHNVYARELDELGATADDHQRRLLIEQRRVLDGGQVHCFVANSELAARELEQRHGIRRDRCAVIYPGHDPDRFCLAQRHRLRAAARRELGLNDGQLLAGFVTSGNFPLRGSDIFVDTLAGLSSAASKALVVLCLGSKANTRRFAERMRRQCPGIRLVTRSRSGAIESFYAALDLLFHPARFETFGLVPMEAAAFGTPVLTSWNTGAAEILGEPRSGMIARTATAEAFLPLLQQLLTRPDERHALAARQTAAVKPYTWDSYTRTFLDLIRKRKLLQP